MSPPGIRKTAIMEQIAAENGASFFAMLLHRKQTEKRDLIAGKNGIYLYHNAIDTIG